VGPPLFPSSHRKGPSNAARALLATTSIVQGWYSARHAHAAHAPTRHVRCSIPPCTCSARALLAIAVDGAGTQCMPCSRGSCTAAPRTTRRGWRGTRCTAGRCTQVGVQLLGRVCVCARVRACVCVCVCVCVSVCIASCPNNNASLMTYRHPALTAAMDDGMLRVLEMSPQHYIQDATASTIMLAAGAWRVPLGLPCACNACQGLEIIMYFVYWCPLPSDPAAAAPFWGALAFTALCPVQQVCGCS